MLDPRLEEKMQQAYIKIGDIGYKIALNIKAGKDYIKKQETLYDQGIKIWTYLKVLFRHVDTSTTPPTLYHITELQVNKLIRVIEEIAELDPLPIVPSLKPYCKPIIINKGQAGSNGTNGQDGTDANIVVEPDTGETDIVVTEAVVSGVKHYKLRLDIYKAPTISVQIAAPKVYEIGVEVASKNINIITTKGSKNITSVTLTDVNLNADLQSILNLATVNGVSQPVTNTVADTTITTNTTYEALVGDGVDSYSANDTINFYYPILYGNNASILTTTHYSALNKMIVGKGAMSIPFNATNNYFYICVPASYGTITIKDQNGFDMALEFTGTLIDVTSIGLDNNWTVSYRVYRTNDKTDIVNRNYTVTYNS